MIPKNKKGTNYDRHLGHLVRKLTESLKLTDAVLAELWQAEASKKITLARVGLTTLTVNYKTGKEVDVN